MSDRPLPPDVRALLDDAGPQEGPGADETSRLWARLEGTLGLPPLPDGGPGPDEGGPAAGPDAPAAPPAPAPAVATAAPVAAKAGLALLAKPVPLALAMFALGTATGVGLHAGLSPSVAPGAVAAAPEPPAAAAAEAPEAPPAKPPVVVRRKPVQPLALTDEQLAEERGLVDMARSALARGEHAAALDAITRHEQRFPAGRLGEERDFLRIQALGSLGRPDEAREALRRFEAAHPRSLFLPALRTLAVPGADE